MIDDTSLAIVRAALTFWDEEMGAVDRSVYKHYLHSFDSTKTLTADDIAETRQYFNNVEIRIGSVDLNTGQIQLTSPSSAAGQPEGPAREELIVLVPRVTGG